MLDGYHVLTLTHRQASLQTIGQAVVHGEDYGATLRLLKSRLGWEELLYLATCNRVVYLFYTPVRPSAGVAQEVLAAVRPELPVELRSEIAAKMRLLHGADAVRHFLEVAASMDSLVVGEREIIRQLREAYERCRDEGLTGDHIRLLLRFTVETAKEIYTTTGIGEKALSVVALAFNRLLETGLRPDARVLLIGAGQTNTLVAKFLNKYGYRNVTVFNRTLAKAQTLADYLGGQALPLDALPEYRRGFDALIVCTGATAPLVTPDLYARLLVGETSLKVVVDLAVPNNADRRIARDFPVHYIEIESLREQAQENLGYREEERRKAETLITAKMRQFRELWHQRQVERALQPVVEEVRAAKNRAFEAVYARELALLDPQSRDLLERMMGYLEKKSVAACMKTMKEIATGAGRHLAETPA